MTGVIISNDKTSENFIQRFKPHDCRISIYNELAYITKLKTIFLQSSKKHTSSKKF